MTATSRTAASSEMETFYKHLSDEGMAPLWEVLRELAPREPMPVAKPAIWRAETVREAIMTAGRLVTAEQAERRVVVLENPALRGRSQVTTSLYAGVQLVLPGELARSHRHTASALRLILEGEGGYTIVDGERVEMHRGDFIITPTWSFHEHGAEGTDPVMWLDGLDVPIVNLLSAGFAGDASGGRQSVTKPLGDSLSRYASGLIPLSFASRSHTSPVFWYPYSRTREALQSLRRAEKWDTAEGLRMAYVDPTSGRSPIRTMGAFLQLLPAAFDGARIRSTDGAVYAVVEGQGTVTVGDNRWYVKPNDIFVVPSWAWHSVAAQDEMILFSFSDRPLQQDLGFWREEREV